MTTVPNSIEGNPPTGFRGERAELGHAITINASPEKIFPLLCPVREGEWAEGWKGRPIYSESGVSEEDGVFATEHPDQAETIWYVTRYDASEFFIELLYIVPEMQIVRLSMKVDSLSRGKSSIAVRYIRTGITHRGNEAVLESNAKFIPMMTEWGRALDHFLATGEMLRGSH